MGWSSIALEQRAKEAEALSSVLIFSLIGSLVLHLGLLTLGNINFLNKAPKSPEIEEEPIEVVIVDPPTPEVEQPKQELAQAKNSLSGGSSLGGGFSNPTNSSTPKKSSSASKLQVARTTPQKSRTTTRTLPSPTPRVAPSPAPTTATRQPIPDTTESKQKLIEDLKKAPVSQPKQALNPEPAQTPAPKPSPEVATSPPQPAPTSQPLATNQTQQIQPTAPARTSTQDAAGSRDALNKPNGNSDRKSVATGSGSGSGGTSTGNDTGAGRGGGGSGSGTAIGTGSGQRNSRGEGSGIGDAEGAGSGVACRRNCKPKYPELARRQGKEGRVAVRVVTDGNGNVASAEIARSSGNADLDAAALKQARRAKVDASPGKPVTMNFTFSLKD